MADLDLSALEASGTYDPGAELAHERVELLSYLAEQGATTEMLTAAWAESGLVGLFDLSASFLLGVADVSLTAAAAELDLDPEQTGEVWTALGFPPEVSNQPFFARDEVAELARASALMRQVFDTESSLAMLRVAGRSASMLAEAAVHMFSSTIEPSGAHRTERERAVVAAMATSAFSSSAELFRTLLVKHFRLAVTRARRSRTDDSERLDYIMAVGFVDLVGFTPFVESMTIDELSDWATRFEADVTRVVTSGGGRVNKLIGDEVMFITTEPQTAVDIAADLLHALGADTGGEAARGGIAHGRVVAHLGDYFGPVVNLAARAAAAAQPGEILLSESVSARLERLPVGMDSAPALDTDLKGLGPVRLHPLVSTGAR